MSRLEDTRREPAEARKWRTGGYRKIDAAESLWKKVGEGLSIVSYHCRD